MSTKVVCDFDLNVNGTQSQANLNAQLAAVPLDLSLPQLWGAIPTSDVTSNIGGTQIRRRIQLTFDNGATAAITPTMQDSRVSKLTLGAVAGWWAAIPILQFTGGFTTPKPAGAIQTPAQAQAVMGLGTALIARGGTGYTAPTASLVGGNLAPGGTPAVLGAVTQVAGVITAVAITSAGSGYTQFPVIVISDPTGSGAEVYGALTVVGATLTNPGYGYSSVPTMSVLPLLPQMGGNAGLPPSGGVDPGSFRNWMTGVIKQTMRTPVLVPISLYS